MIIHNSHLETLAQMCTLLKVEMIEERCGASIVSPPAALVTNSPTSHLEQFFSVKNDPRAGFVKVMGECVADIVERIIYRYIIIIINYAIRTLKEVGFNKNKVPKC
jgi:hypothetical protein